MKIFTITYSSYSNGCYDLYCESKVAKTKEDAEKVFVSYVEDVVGELFADGTITDEERKEIVGNAVGTNHFSYSSPFENWVFDAKIEEHEV